MLALQITPALRVFFTLTYTETVYVVKMERYTACYLVSHMPDGIIWLIVESNQLLQTED